MALLPLFFIYNPQILRFDFSFKNFGYILAISAVTAIGFYFILNNLYILQRPKSQVTFSTVFQIIGYAIIIALPEEIIFRGIVQGYLQSKAGALTAILLSALIFGLAHLPNGAKGWKLQEWNWRLMFLACLGGLPLGLIFLLTNSLLIPTILHGLFSVVIKIFIDEKIYKKD